MAESFDADWLSLREPVDAAARSRPLALRFLEATRARGSGAILDLGCGTGANLRYLAGLMDGAEHGRLMGADQDATLLERLRLAGGMNPDVLRVDLADLDAIPWEQLAGVTCSALLDLVSQAWLADLFDRLAAHRLPFLAALNVDGTHAFDPAHQGDDARARAFAVDQARDKGFGDPALGAALPDAARVAAARTGMRIDLAPTPWCLGPDRPALARAFLSGYALGHDQGDAPAGAWLKDRLGTLEAGRLTITVGHVDMLAWM